MNEIVVRLRTVPLLSRLDRVWLSTGLIMAVLVAIVPAQGQESSSCRWQPAEHRALPISSSALPLMLGQPARTI